MEMGKGGSRHTACQYVENTREGQSVLWLSFHVITAEIIALFSDPPRSCVNGMKLHKKGYQIGWNGI